MIDNFSIFKNDDKKKDTEPDYRISIKVGEEYVDGGACWLKQGKTGKYFSCSLKKPYKGKDGFHILPLKETLQESSTLTSPDENGNRIDLKDSPF